MLLLLYKRWDKKGIRIILFKKKLELQIVHTTFFDDMINVKNLDPNKIKTDGKPYKNILIYHIGSVISRWIGSGGYATT